MSNLRNSVRLVGFLGSDPEVKVVANNKKVARVSIATNDYHKNEKGETVEETQWHNLVMWEKTASLAESYLHKGSEISIEGQLKSRVYTDKAGVKKYFTEVLVNDVMFIGPKKDK
jgi:single-strand DNA-binding protein